MKKIPVIEVTRDDIKKFCRLEITYDEFKKGEPDGDIHCTEPYFIRLDDIYVALKGFKRKGMTEEDLGQQWFFPMWDELYNLISIEDAFEQAAKDEGKAEGFPTEYSVFYEIWYRLQARFEYEWEGNEIKDMLHEIKVFLDNKDKPISKKKLTSSQKKDFIRYWDSEDLLSARKVIVSKYKEFIEDLCKEKDYDSLRFKAYACYGYGEFPYKQDWKESERALLTLMEISPDARWANTLGYIYYYGRVNKGVPEYDKAFKYFSIGAAGWFYESRYKLADMFLHGYGVQKDINITRSIIWELYKENIKYMRIGRFASNFADVALRTGNLYRDGLEGYNSNMAFYYYLQALYAIRKRIELDNNYGDKSVEKGILEAIQKILPDTIYTKRKATLKMDTLEYLLGDACGRKHKLEMTVTEIGENEYSLKFRVLPYGNDLPTDRLIFLTVPDCWYCESKHSVTVKVKTKNPLKIKKPVVFDEISGYDFYNYGKRVARIQGEYVFKAPSKRLL